MKSGEIYNPNYKAHFSGHETFPLKYGWLKKAFDAVSDPDVGAEMLNSDEAISYFGLGRNMVTSMKHWAIATGVLGPDEQRGGVKVSKLGVMLLGEDGLDPYLEHQSSIWVLHWQLCSPASRTTWHWVFNYLSQPTFERDQLVDRLFLLAGECHWPRASRGTIKRDVECLVRSYASKANAGDDALESPFVELGLIQPIGKRDGFRLNVGAKPMLGPGVFSYSIADFWLRHSEANTLSFEQIAYAPGSPGRVFRLEENDLVTRLELLSDLTDGRIRWSETAGLKQLTRQAPISGGDILALLKVDYDPQKERAAA